MEEKARSARLHVDTVQHGEIHRAGAVRVVTALGDGLEMTRAHQGVPGLHGCGHLVKIRQAILFLFC